VNGQRNLIVSEVDSTTYRMIWEQVQPQNQTSHIYFSYTNDSGENISKSIRLSNYTSEVEVRSPFGNSSITNGTVAPPQINFGPQMATLGNQTHVVWEGYVNETGKFNIFYTFSNDGGVTFSVPIDISPNQNQDFTEPRISIAEDSEEPFITFLADDGPVVPCRGSRC
jgi:hypothetical protein